MSSGPDATAATPSPQLVGLCALSVRTLPVDGASVIMISRGGHRSYLAGVGRLSPPLEELQSTTAEGPGPEADRTGVPVLVGHLDTDSNHRRWPIYTAGALALGAAAVFAVPLRIGVIELGNYVTYRRTRGNLTGDQLSHSLQIADACAWAVLDLFAPVDGAASGVETAAARDGGEPDGDHVLDGLMTTFIGAEVHRASGMVMVQLNVPIDAALARLRAYAFAHERLLGDVARDVVAGKLVFEG